MTRSSRSCSHDHSRSDWSDPGRWYGRGDQGRDDDRGGHHHHRRGDDSSYCNHGNIEPKVLSVGDSRAIEGNAEIFSVTLSGAVHERLEVSLALAGGTATAGSDFRSSLDVSFDGGGTWNAIGSDGLPTVAAGEMALQLRVQTVDDFEAEQTESLTLKATVESGGTFTATGTIYDNDFAFARAGNPGNALLAADVLGGDTHPGIAPAPGAAASSSDNQVAAVLLLPADGLLRHLAAQPPAFA